MIEIVLNTIALEPNRWTPEKVAFFMLDRLLAPIAKKGFAALEIWQYHLSRESPAAIKNLARQAADLGLRCPIIGAYPQLHLEGTARQRELDSMAKLFEYGNFLQAEIVKIWLGALASKALSEAARQRSLDCLADLLAMAGAHELVITAENHDNTLLDSVNACRETLAAPQAKGLKICYQPYDFADTEKAVADYRALADRVIHVHFQGRKKERFVLLREAEIDYAVLVQALATHNFDGYWSIEFVEDCVAPTPDALDLPRVLDNAEKDRLFLERLRERYFGA